jgi:DNA-binding transcriptional MocR family regulator
MYRGKRINQNIVTMTKWQPDISELPGPRYLAIADQLAEAIDRGDLTTGDRLPPQRDLAWTLGVTLGTVTRAYSEAERRGLVVGEVGRGTFVKSQTAEPGWMMPHSPDSAGVIDLTFIIPPHVPDQTPLAQIFTELGQDPEVLRLLNYQSHAGLQRHREMGAAQIARHGYDIAPSQVSITAGAHHGILCAAAAVLQPGDKLLVEALAYPGVQAIARFYNLKLEPVPLDEEGLTPDGLAQAAAQTGAKAVYFVPTLQNPTTATMSPERREAVARVVKQHDLFAIEDELFGLLPEKPLPPVATFAPDNTFFISSLSKILAPGLRVGFVGAPKGHEDAVNRAIRSTCWMAAPLTVEVARRLIETGFAEENLQACRKEAAVRRQIVLEALADWDVVSPPNAIHAWVRLPEGGSSAELAARALGQGLRISPVETFANSRRFTEEGVRICFGAAASREELDKGMEILARVLRESPAASYSGVM